MVKKIISVASAAALLAAFPAATFAQTSVSDNISVRPIPIPMPIYHPFEVTPGNPLHLQGCGGLKAEGKGSVYFRDVNGNIYVTGQGALAVEDSDVSKVTVVGFHHKIHLGHWVVYIGQGEAKAAGSNLDIFFRGKASVSARGCGAATLRGHWKGVYWRFIKLIPIPFPEPIELESLTLDTN